MLFNSFQFLLFFPIVTGIYFLLPHKLRWLHLLLASCFFYMCFVPVYIFILFATIIIDYVAGIMIEKNEGRKRKLFLQMSIVANVGILGFFKYFNFFADNFNALFHIANVGAQIPLLKFILPIGLSFHTFQAMSYTIEVYRGNQAAEKHFGIYALYVMFYPQLVAGPIERPQNMLHQFHKKHELERGNVIIGLKQMLWGFFKKCVIADRLALCVDPAFNHPQHYSGIALFIAAIFFVFQLYCDFSGYSDIAIGTAKIMGFDLMVNFDRPYASKSMSEFWRRWHISLSSWLYDYIFNPTVTALRNWGKKAIVFGLFFTFLLSGLWHGAGWNFIIWGMIYGVAMVYEFYTKKTRKKLFKKLPPRLNNGLSVFFTFSYMCFAEIFFRSHILNNAFYITAHLFSGWGQLLSMHGIKAILTSLGENDTIFGTYNVLTGILLIIFMEYIQNRTKDKPAMDIVKNKPVFMRWGFYCLLILSLLVFGAYNNQEFIYFQF